MGPGERTRLADDAGALRSVRQMPVSAPCIHPELATTSPEAQGMWVSEICKQAGVNYNNGKNTVTYVGAAFFQEPEQKKTGEKGANSSID